MVEGYNEVCTASSGCDVGSLDRFLFLLAVSGAHLWAMGSRQSSEVEVD